MCDVIRISRIKGIFSFLLTTYCLLLAVGCKIKIIGKEKGDAPSETQGLIFYHATSDKNVESIQKDGFLLSKGGTGAGKNDEEFKNSSINKIHLTESYTTALHYAYFIQCRQKETPVIISVKFTGPEYKKFQQDPYDSDAVILTEDIKPSQILLVTKDLKTKDSDCKTLFRDDQRNTQFFILQNEPIANNTTPAPFKNCETTFQGKTFGPNQEFCAVKNRYFTLRNKNIKGETAPFADCVANFKGKVYGEHDELCAVTKKYSEFGTEILADGSEVTCPNCEKKFSGNPFGPHGEFCATLNYQSLKETGIYEKVSASECEEKFSGIPYGPQNEFCAVMNN